MNIADKFTVKEDTVVAEVTLFYDNDVDEPEFEDVYITYPQRSRYTMGNKPVDEEEFSGLRARAREGSIISLPVYAYVHSGVTIRTGEPFGCPWDSGMSGIVYVERDKALKWFGENAAVMTPERRATTLNNLRNFVEEYDKWLRGDCYGYIINVNGEEQDSCWGFIGYDYAKEEAIERAKLTVKHLLNNRRGAWRKALRERRQQGLQYTLKFGEQHV